MGAQDNGELIRGGYEAFSKAIWRRLPRSLHRTFVGRSVAVTRSPGRYNGQDETFAFFGKLMELTDGTFTVGVHDLLASDDHVVVLAKESASRNGTSLESDDVHVWHVADGRAVEFWGISRDQHEVDEFWS